MRNTGPRREAISSRLRPARSERGSVAVSMILIPLAFLAVFSTIQLALIVHGRNIATAAAEDALFTTAQFGGDIDDGIAAGEAILALHNGVQGNVDVRMNGDIVVVQITGQISAPLGFMTSFDIGKSGPEEKFYLESER